MHLPIAATFVSIGDCLSEKTVSVIYAFLDMHILFANYFLNFAAELYCYGRFKELLS